MTAGGVMVSRMASNTPKGTVFQSPGGMTAVRTGPAVTAGQYFIFDPDNGGYYEGGDEKVTDIESNWKRVDALPPAEPEASPAAPTMPTSPAAPAVPAAKP